MVKTPSLKALKSVCSLLEAANIKFALGGSALMSFYGAEVEINDWDITTDHSFDEIEPVLRGLDYEVIPESGIFKTKAFCKISFQETKIDLMMGFALMDQRSGEIYKVPTLITGYFEGVPVGCPKAWEKAYRIMGRVEKADFLKNLSL